MFALLREGPRMAQEHDLFDDIIEISKGFDFHLKTRLGGVTDALDPSAPQWNPADYKEAVRAATPFRA